jgi:hypothetical protein
VTIVEGDLPEPECPGQAGIMVGMGLEIDEVGIGAANPEHLVRGGGQGGDVRVDHLDRSARPDREAFQPRGRVVPDQLLGRDVEAVEFHERFPFLLSRTRGIRIEAGRGGHWAGRRGHCEL